VWSREGAARVLPDRAGSGFAGLRLVDDLVRPVAPFAGVTVGSGGDVDVAPWAGGGDGVVSGPLRTVGWVLVIGGALASAGGVGVYRQLPAYQSQAAGLLGGGVVAGLAGAIIIWATGCVSCSTCGIVENERRDDGQPGRVPAPPEAPLVLAWGGRF
jgi:hypothetical protein